MIELRDVSLRAGDFLLSQLSLSIPEGTYAVLMGGTGQGKTTILEAICGLRPVETGRIVVDHRDVTRTKPADRCVGYVPQDLGLFPTMTVREHLEFALRVRRAPAATIRERVAELAHVLGIEPLLGRGMTGLSGGESQRVALGRALSFRPRVLLLDEPLTALDEPTRDRLCELLRTIQRENGLTLLHITHSKAEALLVAQTLIILEGGRLDVRPVNSLNGRSRPGEPTAATASLPSRPAQ